MTQLGYAKKGIITPLVKETAKDEKISAATLSNLIKDGKAVIPNNVLHKIKRPCAIGSGLRTKVNANIGTSTDRPQLFAELEKLKIAVKYGSDAIMDLSVGGDLKKIREEVIKHSPVPVGTVPIYELAVEAKLKRNNFLRFDKDDALNALENQAKQGVDFFTLHAGVTKKSLAALKRKKRVLGIVSRGGAIISSWISLHKKENPFYEFFDEVLEIAARYDVTLSLGDGLRPGSILDATDLAQISELKILGELVLRARKRNVQVMIEGPGHVPLGQIKQNVELEKKVCHGAPFYVLGPLVTDIASGYDHISSAIGGAIAASYGADFLCYVTSAEHLKHPSAEDVREGVIAARIAAHSADIVKNPKLSMAWDRNMSLARKKRDWKRQIRLSIDPQRAMVYRESSKPHQSGVCTMCGDYCSIKMMERCLRA
ncbi:MAG: phosphomethylpyrimidine synthase ThiC [Candidatus Omnitrophota bacterium]